MKNQNYIISYNGVNIPFIADLENGNSTMINATKMAQCFPSKRLDHFLENQTTKDYINALSADTGKPVSELLKTKKGGNDRDSQGTWMHEDLAIEFARWLNPEFSVWCNTKIEELLTNGTATLENEEIRLQQINSQLQQNNFNLQQAYDQMEPGANYSYQILKNSKITYNTTEICKGFSCRIPIQDVLARLEKEGYISRSSNSKTWSLKAPHDQNGYTKQVNEVVHDKNGQTSHTVSQVKWTENGRWFLRSILLSWGVIPSPQQIVNP